MQLKCSRPHNGKSLFCTNNADIFILGVELRQDEDQLVRMSFWFFICSCTSFQTLGKEVLRLWCALPMPSLLSSA